MSSSIGRLFSPRRHLQKLPHLERPKILKVWARSHPAGEDAAGGDGIERPLKGTPAFFTTL